MLYPNRKKSRFIVKVVLTAKKDHHKFIFTQGLPVSGVFSDNLIMWTQHG